MQRQDETDLDAYDRGRRRRTLLIIVVAAAVIIVLGVLHATGVMGSG
ncbi:MAG TPA: hypothetical protein VKD67_13380 [Acidimicrobiales bacterium]|nr:hypothetical protein [Acidimicrobiales bacterium]